MLKYVGRPPSLAELGSDTNAIGGGNLRDSEGVDGGDGSFEGGWLRVGVHR